jgi:hypothetical protein
VIPVIEISTSNLPDSELSRLVPWNKRATLTPDVLPYEYLINSINIIAPLHCVAYLHLTYTPKEFAPSEGNRDPRHLFSTKNTQHNKEIIATHATTKQIIRYPPANNGPTIPSQNLDFPTDIKFQSKY